MTISIRALLLIGLLFFCSFPAQADLPLDIEGLLTDKGKLKLDFGMTYANRHLKGLAVGDQIAIQLNPTQFVFLPVTLGEQESNIDILIPLIGLRYGLTADTEVLTKSTWLFEQTRTQRSDSTNSTNSHRFNDAWIGASHRFNPEANFPGLIGFAEIAVAERSGRATTYGKSLQIGATVYRSLDPVVLSLTSSFQYRRARTGSDGLMFKPGNVLVLAPQLSMALNDKVTLTNGISWRNQWGDKKNRTPASMRHTASTLNLGMSYLWNRHTALTLTTRSSMNGSRGVEISLAIQMKLENLLSLGVH